MFASPRLLRLLTDRKGTYYIEAVNLIKGTFAFNVFVRRKICTKIALRDSTVSFKSRYHFRATPISFRLHTGALKRGS